MKLQHLVIIFLVIMLPIVLIMSQYTSLQIDTLSKKTQYDTALLGATFDTMAAFELNTINSESSSVVGEEIRDIEAIISTFTNSLSSHLNITGVSNDYILSYVPAMVFTLYDGYYIYAVSGTGNTNERELKPYVYYTKTYTNNSNGTNITIAFSLDNYVSIYGTYYDTTSGSVKNVSAAGYLVNPNDVEISDKFAYVTSTKENGSATTNVIDPGGKSKISYKGISIEKETIYENQTVSETRGLEIDEQEETTDAMMYYYEAKQFSELYNKIIGALTLQDQNILLVSNTNDPEDETSLFMNEKVNVIKDSITTNLNAAIYNYEGAVSEVYEMPQLNGEDWDKILNDISIITFLKDIPIGTTTYNNYVIVNSTTNKKYVSSKSLDFISYSGDVSTGYYHKITCDNLIENIKNGQTVIGYASVDFERYKYSPQDENEYYYYYKHNEYADYDCEVNPIKSEGVATIKQALIDKGIDANLQDKVLKTYYTAVGRVRYRLVKASSYINSSNTDKSFRITYNTNSLIYSNATWSDGSTVRTVNSTYGNIKINQEIPKKSGYTFVGWSTNRNAITPEVKTGDVLYSEDGTSNLILYAIFVKQFTITYNLNGGFDGPNPSVQTKIKDQAVVISKTRPTKENHTFLGWSTSQNGPVEFTPGQVFEENRDITLYAIWEENAIIITLDSNKGIYSAKDILTKRYGQSIALVSNNLNLTLTGYDFLGWSEKSGDTVPQYVYGATYSADRNITLYAVWKEKTSIITYDANGGNELPIHFTLIENRTKTYGRPYQIIPEIKPTKDNCEFVGWSTNKDAIIGEYQPGDYILGDTVDSNGNLTNITLYAIWEGDTYTVEYNANGGKNAPLAERNVYKNRDIIISSTIPERVGYTFAGWSTNAYAKETEVEYYAGDKYTGRENIKLYAVWRKANYTIVYIANGKEFTTQYKTHGKNINITLLIPTKEDYVFYGWSKTEGSTTVDYLTNQIFGENANTTLYAVWKYETKGTIIYNANGGENPPPTQIVTDVVPQISTQEPTRDNYTFIGWSTDANASVAEYRPGDIIRENIGSDNLTLYAVWKGKSYTVTLDANGGENVSFDSQEVTYNSTYGLLPEAEREGYTFDGWYTDKTGGTEITEETIVSIAENHTIYAHWTKEEKTYNVYYSTQLGGTGIPYGPKNVKEGEIITLSTKVPTKEGYEFIGWNNNKKQAENGTAKWKGGDTFEMPATNVTIYPVWKAKQIQVTLKANGGTIGTELIKTITVTYGKEYGSLPKPSNGDMLFDGWYTDKTGGTKITEKTIVSIAEAHTLYAHWNKEINRVN